MNPDHGSRLPHNRSFGMHLAMECIGISIQQAASLLPSLFLFHCKLETDSAVLQKSRKTNLQRPCLAWHMAPCLDSTSHLWDGTGWHNMGIQLSN